MKNFEILLIVWRPACKIWKLLKNGNLISQLAKICSLWAGVFFKNPRSKTPFCSKFLNFYKNHTIFYIILCDTALSIILDLDNQNLLRIEWVDGNFKLSQEKNKFSDLGVPSVAPKISNMFIKKLTGIKQPKYF